MQWSGNICDNSIADSDFLLKNRDKFPISFFVKIK